MQSQSRRSDKGTGPARAIGYEMGVILYSLDPIPAPLIQVSEHLTDDDLMWVNEHLTLVDRKAIRGTRDLRPAIPPTRVVQ